MGLEKLKSIFSNLEKFNRTDLKQFDSKFDDIEPIKEISKKVGTDTTSLPNTPQKIGTDVTNNMKNIDKIGTGVTNNMKNIDKIGTDVNSLPNTPEKVGMDVTNNMENIDKIGTDVTSNEQSNLTNMTSIYSIETEPQEVNFSDVDSKYASGFKAKWPAQSAESAVSDFIGITEDSGITTWESTTGFHSVENLSLKGPVDFMGGDNSYYTTLDPVIPGFTNGFNTGGYTFGIDDKGNSKYIDSEGVMIPTGTHTEYHDAGMTFNNSWTYEPNFIPPDGTTWTNSGSYYDSIHTTNAISHEFGTPVSFMDNGLGFTLNQGDSQTDIVSNYLTAEGGLAATVRHTIDGYIFDSDLENSVPNNLFFSDTIKIQSGVDNINSSKGSNKGGEESLQFKTLYTNSNTATDNKYLGELQDGSDINIKDRFDIKSELWNYTNSRDMSVGGGVVLGLSSAGLGNIPGAFGGNGNEPYIIRDIGDQDNPSNYFPMTTLMRDASRVSKFLGSNKGEQFVINQNLMGSFQQYRPYYDAGSTILNTALPSEGLGTPIINFPRDFGLTGALIDLVNTANTYTEWIDTRDTGADSLSVIDGKNWFQDKTHAEREIARKPLAYQLGDALESAASSVVNSLIPGGDTQSPKDPAGIKSGVGITSKKNVNTSISGERKPFGDYGKGDLMTLLPVEIPDKDSNLNLPGNHSIAKDITSHGMPLYFKDLRDGAALFFRAYVEGISDTISPTWNSENYIGRSEPVYTYTNAEREIGFNLKLFANTKDELNMIYKKMNRLASLCYPEYKSEVVFKDGKVDEAETKELGSDARIMMKAPLVKFRLGELFGSTNAEMTGFIKSLSFEFPDESPWEIQNGYRVPKYITVSLGFQVIHGEVPSLDFARDFDSKNNATMGNSFYGINSITGVE